MQRKLKYNYSAYLKNLEATDPSFYEKYISDILKFSKKDSKFLDIGCGSGTVLLKLQQDGMKNLYGCDVSDTFVNECKKKNLTVSFYDGEKLPYSDESFDIVGSFTVFEHVEDPELFLNEKLKVLKPGGYLILGCPNFATVLYNNPHRLTVGFRNKIKNFLLILTLLFGAKKDFIRVEPIVRDEFSPDDDAIVLTNLVQLERFFLKKKMKIVKKCGFISKNNKILDCVGSFFLLRYFLPSCYLIVKKI